MRIWHVPFDELDGQRVLGQHNEIHALWGLIVGYGQQWDPRWSEQATRRLLWDVHERTVVEMRARGWNGHLTPLLESKWGPGTVHFRAPDKCWCGAYPCARVEDVWQETEYAPAKRMAELFEIDRWDLVNRWAGAYQGRVDAPYGYVPLIGRFWAQGGCHHDGRREDFKRGWQLCLICKRYATNDKGRSWVVRESVTEVTIRGYQY